MPNSDECVRAGRPRDLTALTALRVVIVEDEGITQLQLRRVLTRAGLQVVGAAANGRDGVALVLSERPDLVLMDIRMPVMDGIEALDAIMRETPVCVVMLTAFSDSGMQRTAVQKGACGYVVKPITGDLLLPRLAEAHAAFQKTSPKSDPTQKDNQ